MLQSPKMSKCHVAIIQNNAIADSALNCRKILASIDEAVAKGATFILLPETFPYRAQSAADARVHSESLTGPIITTLQEKAKKYGVTILAGSIAETNPIEDGKVFNTSVLINPRGEIDAVYRKIHLFDANVADTQILESSVYSAGDKPVVGSVGDQKIGLSICYDLRFPYLYEWYRKQGVSMVAVPSSFTSPTGKAHWHTLLKARAIENQIFVLAPDQVGIGARGVTTYGHSLIIGPWGDILAEGSGDTEEIVSAEIDFDDVAKVRALMPKKIREEVLYDTDTIT